MSQGSRGTGTRPGTGRSATLASRHDEKLTVPLGHWTQDMPRRWKMRLQNAWVRVNQGEFGNVHFGLSIYIHIIQCSSNKFRLEFCQNWGEKNKKAEKVWTRKANSDCSFLFRMLSSLFLTFTFFPVLFRHVLLFPFLQAFFTDQILRKTKQK